jgi:hypothetical protein
MDDHPIEVSQSAAAESERLAHGSVSRRSFLQAGTTSAIALGLSPLDATAHTPETHKPAKTMMEVPFEANEPRLGIIGVGGRSTSLLEDLLAANGQVRAICDVVQEKAKHAQQLIEKAGQQAPELYTESDHAYERLLLSLPRVQGAGVTD